MSRRILFRSPPSWLALLLILPLAVVLSACGDTSSAGQPVGPGAVLLDHTVPLTPRICVKATTQGKGNNPISNVVITLYNADEEDPSGPFPGPTSDLAYPELDKAFVGTTGAHGTVCFGGLADGDYFFTIRPLTDAQFVTGFGSFIVPPNPLEFDKNGEPVLDEDGDPVPRPVPQSKNVVASISNRQGNSFKCNELSVGSFRNAIDKPPFTVESGSDIQVECKLREGAAIGTACRSIGGVLVGCPAYALQVVDPPPPWFGPIKGNEDLDLDLGYGLLISAGGDFEDSEGLPPGFYRLESSFVTNPLQFFTFENVQAGDDIEDDAVLGLCDVETVEEGAGDAPEGTIDLIGPVEHGYELTIDPTTGFREEGDGFGLIYRQTKVAGQVQIHYKFTDGSNLGNLDFTYSVDGTGQCTVEDAGDPSASGGALGDVFCRIVVDETTQEELVEVSAVAQPLPEGTKNVDFRIHVLTDDEFNAIDNGDEVQDPARAGDQGWVSHERSESCPLNTSNDPPFWVG